MSTTDTKLSTSEKLIEIRERHNKDIKSVIRARDELARIVALREKQIGELLKRIEKLEADATNLISAHDEMSAQVQKHIKELEAEQRSSESILFARIDRLEADINRLVIYSQGRDKQLDKVCEVVIPHITDLINTANTLEEYQDPMVGHFDGTIAELRKAANELQQALKQDND